MVAAFPLLHGHFRVRGHIELYGHNRLQVISLRNYIGLPLPMIRVPLTQILSGLTVLQGRGIVYVV
jgi:hypothetical protein